MSGNTLRREVLQAFKQLHLTRKRVFKDDANALNAARKKINEEFKKNKSVADQSAVHEMIIFANAVEEELRTSVIQAVQTKPGTYEVRVTKDTVIDNIPFPDSTPKNVKTPSKKKKPMPSLEETMTTKSETEKTPQSAKISP